jgi:hypothetical protein
VVACTNTTKRHDDLRALGAEPTLSIPSRSFPNVAFLVTPNAANWQQLCQDSLAVWQGPEEVSWLPVLLAASAACLLACLLPCLLPWPLIPSASSALCLYSVSLCACLGGSAQDGSFVMSSSVGVFAKNDAHGRPVGEGTLVNEEHPTNASASNFSRTLLGGEDAVLERGGSVLRIAGMYNLRGGRNSFFLKGGDIARRRDAYLPLVAYSDVVDAALKVFMFRLG